MGNHTICATMSVPPSWKDLGKASNDLLGKYSPTSGQTLEVKTRAPNNVLFKVAGSRNSSTAAIAGDLEGKYSDPKHGVTLTQTWTTKNQLKSLLELENQIAKGLKIDVNSTLEPDVAGKSALINTTYKQPGFHVRGAFNVFNATFTPDLVFGRDGFLLGAESTYDIRDGQIKGYNAAVGYSSPEYAVTLHALQKLSTFSASYYHKVNSDVEAGAKAIYNTKAPTSNVALEVGVKSYLDRAAFVKAKLNTSGILNLGYTQSLRPGVKASFGVALDTQKLGETQVSEKPNGPAHSVGASFTFEG